MRVGRPLFAANFHAGTVDVFNRHFQLVSSFSDAKLANTCPLPGQCYAPFGIQNIGGTLYVTYALQGEDAVDDVAGVGHGYIDAFDTAGNLLRRVASKGPLNSPWGLAVSPGDFGLFSDALLVGNFGDGRINAYNLRTGAFLGQLTDPHGVPIQIEGLWALGFGRDSDWGRDDDDDVPNNALYFTSGPADESHGLLGVIVPARRNRHGD